MGTQPGIVIVARQTRMQGLLSRWVTPAQAKFLIRQAHVQEAELAAPRATATIRRKPAAAKSNMTEADFAEYQREDETYRQALETIERELDFGLPVRVLDRAFVPNFDFWTCAVVVVVGQDGLVANTAKYVGDLPIVGVNPDPGRFDGVLLPFQVSGARRAVGNVLEGKARTRLVTLAEATLNDGQKMLAFNDFFVGCGSHVSARYVLEVGGQSEPQSSSGVLISTGAGSTGWFSSVFNMAEGIAAWLGVRPEGRVQLAWEDRQLLWAVREPFASKHSRAGLVAGLLNEGEDLKLESLMPTGGVIFSDGIEADFLQFNSGAIARVRAAEQRAKLVVR